MSEVSNYRGPVECTLLTQYWRSICCLWLFLTCYFAFINKTVLFLQLSDLTNNDYLTHMFKGINELLINNSRLCSLEKSIVKLSFDTVCSFSLSLTPKYRVKSSSREQNLLRISGNFELSVFELSEVKWPNKVGQNQEKWTLLRNSWDFELVKFELLGFNCI